MTATSYFDNLAVSQTRNAYIEIKNCAQTTKPIQNNDNTQVEQKPQERIAVTTEPIEPTITIEKPQEELDTSFVNGTVFTLLLVFANVIAVSILGIMSYGFVKPKEPKIDVPEQKDFY